MDQDLIAISRELRGFAEMCEGSAPLYALLSARAAERPHLCALAAEGQAGQPAANLLFGAVHDLLLSGVAHPLAAYYPSIGGSSPAEDDAAFHAFVDFCDQHESRITEMIRTRRVQTNEVGRCALLLIGLDHAAAMLPGRPLHLIELGCSAGLNLNLDRYRYSYRDAQTGQPLRTIEPSDSPHAAAPMICTAIHGSHAHDALPRTVPKIVGRIGVDLIPVDVADDEAVRWVQAMIWPDHVDRMATFRAAVAVSRAHPPRLIQGDGLQHIPAMVGSVAPDALPCVHHTHAIYQMTDAWRAEFDAMLADVGRTRDIAHVSIEWLGDDPGPRLTVEVFRDGQRTTRIIADCDHHGRWFRWRNEQS